MSNEFPLEIDCLTVHGKLNTATFLLLDCREPDEHAVARIDGARLMPMSQIANTVGELEEHRETHIVVHCHHGGRSLKVASWLREQGFPLAQSMAGGIDRWALEIDKSVPRY